MKEWVKKLTGEEMARIYKNKHLWEKTSEACDQRILTMIAEYKKKHKEKKDMPLIKKLLLAAIVMTILLLPALFIINSFQDTNKLILAKTENDVIFTIQDKIIQLKAGDRVQKNTLIQTKVDSTCKIQFAENAVVNVYKESELKVVDNDKDRVTFALNTGKIHIAEHIKKETRISFYTENAYIYAIGTIYSVEYNKQKNETTIKVFEGLIHIGTIPKQEEIVLKTGEEIIISGDHILCKQAGELTEKKEWKIKTVYYNPNVKEAISGFDVYEEFILAVTKHSIICFTREENLWQYSTKEDIIARPIIFNKKVHIPMKNTILCFDLYTGIKEPDIKTRERMGIGDRIVKYNNNLYFIFTSGIYLFDSSKQEIQSEPFLYVIDATLPVFFNNQIFVTSYISGNVEAYDLTTGMLLWSIPLNDWSSFSPIIINDFLYVGTKKNTLYKIALYGEIVKQKQIEGMIETITANNEQFIYLNTRRNRLFTIDKQTLNVSEYYDNIETVFSQNNTLFLGKKDGIIKIIGEETEKEIVLLNSFVTAFTNHGTEYYAGLNNGYILGITNE